MKREIRRVLVTGALGQIGSELTVELRRKYGTDNVVASDLRDCGCFGLKESGPFHTLDVMDYNQIEKLVKDYEIDTIVHLAALLSGVGEKNPTACWNVNMNGTMNVLNVSVANKINRVFIPSSIAVWGPDCPKVAPQETPLHPTTMYGVTKVAGEVLCDYYVKKFGLDVRGLRYPGIISAETFPGGGTTDYAVAIYYEAVKRNHYTCFVKEDTRLPMMYMPDCLKATMDLLEAPFDKLKHHSDFNVGSMSFDVKTLAEAIKKYKPDFTIDYEPDFRQAIADSWPDSVDDSAAREEWGWNPSYDLDSMTKDMLQILEEKNKAGLI
ncbi:NAD-dependent epimerase/dehydratase family protein [Bacteroidetes/Chlorobi group bacterium ChocPot_Mid]|nr:MAG: NAD-dependent epimerase/dehydratase family protein [Bacteroidetes/Chlorobi group bacterium ChocPot_Mid]